MNHHFTEFIFADDSGRLHIDGLDAVALADQFRTPLYHAVAAHAAAPPPDEVAPVDIVGPLCTFDLMGGPRSLPALRRDDVLAFLNAGAYGETKAATFNAQPRPATVLVNGSRPDIITERETLRDVIGRFRIPPHLLGNGAGVPAPFESELSLVGTPA